ncbi:MAG: xanthine dehydrogenase family protein molybdopterin-binding subunit [Actinomycetota bacterium]|nr:xanthine dehydrogenase family protein molybdopterin-binding subunit [Actinomycetota bacterium]
MVGSILGTRVTRKEDPKFITTGGVYLDDLRDEPLLRGALHVAYYRSPVAHGDVRSIEVADAAAMPGVVAVLTGSDLGLEPVPADFSPGMAAPMLAAERVRYVGEPMVAVVAESSVVAADAVDAIWADIDPRPAVVDPEEALEDTILLYEETGSNTCLDSTALGRPDLTDDEFFAGCDVVVSHRIVNQRLAPCPLEVRVAAAAWDGERLVAWMSSQHVHGARDEFAKAVGVDPDSVRVVTPDVGGGFGAKISPYPEELLVAVIARHVGRPIRWTETRSESMVGLGHGRAQVQFVTIGGDREGTVSHYRLKVVQDSGAFPRVGSVLAPFMTLPMASGVYAIPNIEARSISVVTNTTPVVAYRGAGRPEATAAIERAMDLFALETGLDPVDVRRRNLIAPFDEPYTTATGQSYDCGDYAAALDVALQAADYETLRSDQAVRRASGDPVQIGIGVSTYVEITGGIDSTETARIVIDDDGGATVFTGVSPHGQGHDTTFSMLVSERTGIPMDRITLRWGDTDAVATGGGTMGSRSLQHGGAAVDRSAADLVEAATRLAATRLEAAEADVVLDVEHGRFHVAGTPSVATSWGELAGGADEQTLTQQSTTSSGPSFPFGAHIAVVHVDTDTGKARLVRHVACDDAGTMINPLLVEGQEHGGIAQGAAQALLEEVRYDEDGNPITANLIDYAMVSAAELPSFELVHLETPTPVNPLGAKGIGESGTIGATPAIHSAVVDAVSHLGVRHIEMPTTPERVWRAIQESRG